jgi:AraC-like DNA-binding protein
MEYNTAHEGCNSLVEGTLDSNWSTADLNLESDGLHFNYALSTTNKEPFASVFFNKKNKDSAFFDLSPYNVIQLKLIADKAQRIPFVITMDMPGLTKKNDPLSHVHFIEQLECKKGENIFSIPIRDLEIPSWWLQYHHLDKDFIKKVDFSRTTFFLVNSCSVIEKGVQDELIIQSIQLAQSNLVLWYALAACVVITLLVECFWFFRKEKKKEIQFTPSLANGKPVTETDKIEAYIALHYSNPDLEIGHLQRDIKISTRKISHLLLEKFSMSFTDYVNQIRIAEVKRLLKESDAPVSTIAHQVGFGNVSHFNRVFKSIVGVSPTQYREIELVVKKVSYS